MFIDRIKKSFNGEQKMSEQKSAVAKPDRLPNGVPNLGDAILQPGSAARKAEDKIPVAAAPAPVIEEVIAQLTPEASSPESGPHPATMQPVDWDEEARIDLPPRTVERIQFLLTLETPEQTAVRIQNDKMRWRRAHGVGE
jgi:hypothetical protein